MKREGERTGRRLPVVRGSNGLELINEYLSHAECESLLSAIREFQRTHKLPLIHRKAAGRSLHYFVLDGEVIHYALPGLVEIYHDVEQVVRERFGAELQPLKNRAASVNVNITPPGGEYRWHYDRNAVTAILYLNTVAGGETEMYPEYRIHLGKRKSARLQKWLDALLQLRLVLALSRKRVLVSPSEGLLLIMRGDRCLHSVRRVQGAEDRINLVMTFDVPRAEFAVEAQLDPYLYSKKPAPAFDPNYRQ